MLVAYRIVSNKGYRSYTYERYGMAFQAKERMNACATEGEVFRIETETTRKHTSLS